MSCSSAIALASSVFSAVIISTLSMPSTILATFLVVLRVLFSTPIWPKRSSNSFNLAISSETIALLSPASWILWLISDLSFIKDTVSSESSSSMPNFSNTFTAALVL